MDFIEIVNRIFLNKNAYKDVSDEDKINSFFIINRKFGKKFPEISKKLNHKSIDKASAIDMWFNFFKDEYKIPQWYWDNRKIKMMIYKKSNENYELIQNREELKDIEIKYLEKYYEDDLKKEIKKINKYD